MSFNIIQKAGPDIQEQLRLVDWCIAKMGQLQQQADMLAGPIEVRLGYLQTKLGAIRSRADSKVSFFENAVRIWIEDSGAREQLGKSFETPNGKIKTRETKGKTELDGDAILQLAEELPAEYGALIKHVLDKRYARERFQLTDDGSTVDVDTGELMGVPLITQIEPPGISTTIIPDSHLTDDEGEDEWDIEIPEEGEDDGDEDAIPEAT